MNLSQEAAVHEHYTIECVGHFHPDGSQCPVHGRCPLQHEARVKWTEEFDNLVVTTGRNALLDNTFNAAAGSVNWFVLLKGAGSVVAGDTMASHAGWSEVTGYSEATRPAWTKNGASSGGAMSNSSSKAAFSINATVTVVGAGLTSNSTKGGTTGTLFGAGDFATSRDCISGDTLNVQVDPSITAS
jgi:hypothetical protein